MTVWRGLKARRRRSLITGNAGESNLAWSLYIYIYASTAVIFATACEGWVLGTRLRKAITKVQKAAKQKPNSKR